MKKKKLSLDRLEVTSFITEASAGSLKGGDSVCNVCVNINYTVDVTQCLDGSLYPTRCCIPERPTQNCTNVTMCDPTGCMQITNLVETC